MSVPSSRSRRSLFVSVILLAWLAAGTCAAMVYRPDVGRFKDSFILWHEGQFYLFSMYTPDVEANFRNVWLATSRDGVHWKHVGPVIKDAPFNIWAMAVHRVGDRFIMNHGSFSDPGVQNVIRFWESADLVHWTFMGHEADSTADRVCRSERARPVRTSESLVHESGHAGLTTDIRTSQGDLAGIAPIGVSM